MHRPACVELPALALQIAVRQQPALQALPAVVLDRDHPGGRVLHANRAALRAHIRTGMRYASALSLCAQLRAAVIPEAELQAARQEVEEILQRFSPGVEAVPARPGLWWVDAEGVALRFGSLEDWSQQLAAALTDAQWKPRLTVGFTRFGALGVNLLGQARRILQSAAEEQALLALVPIDRLGVWPQDRDRLHQLGIQTLGQLVALPREGLHDRFGPELNAMLRQLARPDQRPVQRPATTLAPVTIDLDAPEWSAPRLVFRLRAALPDLIAPLRDQGQQLCALTLVLHMDDRSQRTVEVASATPSDDPLWWSDLLRLRLERETLTAGVASLVLSAHGTTREGGQLALFAQAPRRDPAAAERALARVRAELGDDAVGTWTCGDGHLPEARSRWTPTRTLRLPAPPHRAANDDHAPREPARLCRRMLLRPTPLPPRPRHEPDGWLVRGLDAGPARESVGPWVFEGGWWVRPVRREYWYVQTERGDLFWLYRDPRRRAWFLQGRVE